MIKLKSLRKEIKLKLLSILLKGNNVFCNICNQSFTTFIPHLSRINACCPNCGSLERTRLIWYFLDKKRLLDSSTTLLHVAPEKYLYKVFNEKKNITYFPIDKFTKGYSYPPKTVEMDITGLKYPDNFFNGIICLHVLEHVLEDVMALKEFYRVLKPFSWAIIQVPFEGNRKQTYEDKSIIEPEKRRKHFGQSDHVRIYGADFIDRFTSVGFVVEDWNFQDGINEDIKKKYVFRNEDIFLLRKKK